MQIEIDTLKALLLHAPKKDVREYLIGVHVDLTGQTPVLVATDGHTLLAVPAKAEAVPEGESFTIPRDVVERAIKARPKGATSLGLARTHLGEVRYDPIGQRYPDWRRVAPRGALQRTEAYFNAEYLVRARQSLILTGAAPKVAIAVAMFAPSDDSAHIAVARDEWTEKEPHPYTDVLCLVMPCRADPDISAAGDARFYTGIF